MGPNPQFPVDLVQFAGEILNGKLHFLSSAKKVKTCDPSLHKEVVLKPEWYEKRFNAFDVAEDFAIECHSHQNVSKL